MSSKLVILRHKSWNVWNQDNREKVLRDERLHREQTENNEIGQRKQNIDFKLKELKNNVQDTSSINDAEAKEAEAGRPPLIVPFRLFDEPSTIVPTTNAEYMKEKREKEYKEQVRQGVAPWSLGDVSSGKNPVLPWYVEIPKSSSSSSLPDRKEVDEEKLKSEMDKRKYERELKRQRKEDPMSSILRFSGDKDYDRRDITSDFFQKKKKVDVESLRKKRLEREHAEKKKTELLVANNPDIREKQEKMFRQRGQEMADESRKYSQQYHPSISSRHYHSHYK